MLFAGRCITTGQSARFFAAVLVIHGETLDNVSITAVQDALKEQGVRAGLRQSLHST